MPTEMELTLEQTQQEKFDTSAGNPVKEILLKLNLSDHRKLQKRDLEVGSSALELDQAEGTDETELVGLCARIEDSLERDEGVSTRAILAPTLRLGKRLGDPPSIAVVSASEPSYVETSALASTFGHSLSLGGVVASGRVGKSGAEVMRRQMDSLDFLARSALACDAEYDQIPDDDFGTTTRGEEIDLTLFPLAPGSYHMPYPHEGVSSPLYTREEWNGPYAPEHSILCKDIFKDPDVGRKALDRTIIPAELRRTESLLLLELSNRVNVLSALLVSYGYELNSRYANLVSSKAHLQEKVDKKKGDVKLLHLEVTSLDNKLENLQRGYDALGQENRELHSQRDAASEEIRKLRYLQNELVLEKSKSQEYKDVAGGLREQGLRMGHTVVKFEAVVQKVSNFHVGAKVDFDKAMDDFPTTPFPFLSKIVAASEGSLSDVTQILPDKFVRSATLVAAASSSANEALE
ncbi:hypothetical protein Tco_0856296 [Tanacetum coccineum]|uniref:Uncharacterized protein n=1 Tax=Tanacetum coccineum TaxID=301880 RepID=A0ABQ5B757_9ASTR